LFSFHSGRSILASPRRGSLTYDRLKTYHRRAKIERPLRNFDKIDEEEDEEGYPSSMERGLRREGEKGRQEGKRTARRRRRRRRRKNRVQLYRTAHRARNDGRRGREGGEKRRGSPVNRVLEPSNSLPATGFVNFVNAGYPAFSP